MELEKEEEIKYQSNTSKALILCVRTTYEPACPVCVPAASHRCLLLTGSFNTPTATLPEGFLVTRVPAYVRVRATLFESSAGRDVTRLPPCAPMCPVCVPAPPGVFLPVRTLQFNSQWFQVKSIHKQQTPIRELDLT